MSDILFHRNTQIVNILSEREREGERERERDSTGLGGVGTGQNSACSGQQESAQRRGCDSFSP